MLTRRYFRIKCFITFIGSNRNATVHWLLGALCFETFLADEVGLFVLSFPLWKYKINFEDEWRQARYSIHAELSVIIRMYIFFGEAFQYANDTAAY